MLPQRNRLKKNRDFKKLFEKGKSSKEDFLYLKVKKNNLESSRFAFVVSKKISKKAVIRNKIKRRLRELVKIKLTQIKKGLDIIIVVTPGFEVSDFLELEEIINNLFNKAGILDKRKS